MEVICLVRDFRSDFDKGDLRDDLKHAGFEDCVADNIADRVDDRKAKGWSYGTGRQEAIREAQVFIDSSKAALDNFRNETQTREAQMRETQKGPKIEREPTSREVLTRETY